MHFWEYIFWLSCFIVFYNYAGYAILVYFLNILKRKRKKATGLAADYYPSVSFIVAAYNEEDCIRQKIANSLELNYPGKIEFLFITDGSTDATNNIIKEYPAIQLLYNAERRGKSAALNRVVKLANNDILIFSDANTLLNQATILNITRHYKNEKVGGVAGEKKVLSTTDSSDAVGSSEGAYWKYESFLKKLDSEFYSVVGAAGELFSVRRELYEEVPDKVILDDFVISLKVAQKGYRIIYEPEACAMELPSFSIKDEQKRKVRIAAGGFQAIGMLKPLLMFWKYPRLSFLYISHRVLRWVLSPFCLILALISNIFLAFDPGTMLYKGLLAAQILFYFMAFLSAVIPPKISALKVLRLPYYFVFMNISVIQGFFRFLRRRQPATWEKAKRTQAI